MYKETQDVPSFSNAVETWRATTHMFVQFDLDKFCKTDNLLLCSEHYHTARVAVNHFIVSCCLINRVYLYGVLWLTVK